MFKHYLLALLISAVSTSYAQGPSPASRVKVKALAADGRPLLINLRSDGGGYQASESSRALREQLQLTQDDEMVRIKTETDALGFTHEKYQQYYRGVKVEHATYSVHIRNGVIESLSGLISPIKGVDIAPNISASSALTQALRFVGATQYMWQAPEEEAGLKKRENNPNATYYPSGELVMVADGMSPAPAKRGQLTLAWKFDVYARQPFTRAYIYVDAHTGEIVLQDAIMKQAAGPFTTRYSGTRNVETGINPTGGYRLRETTRGNGVETYNSMKTSTIAGASDFVDNDNNWTASEYDNANLDNIAGDAHFGAEATFDYWKNVHGRNSYNNAGALLRSYVHYWPYQGTGSWDNARWTGTEMVYGDGGSNLNPLTSLDICAHEIGHAVCQSTAALAYAAESGALNEGFSDIWGASIEQYTCAQLGLTKSTWLIGEEVFRNGAAARSMSDPKAYSQPAYYGGQFWVPDPGSYTGVNDYGGVHTNSGVLNHWFYILSEGKSGINEGGKAYAVTGIGIAAAARIAYRTESVYLTAQSNYAAARIQSIQSAADLFGACSAEVTAVINAWEAVGVVGVPASVTGPNEICLGGSATFTVVNPSVRVFSWSSSNPTLATIDATTGVASAVAQGTVTFTASCGGALLTRQVTIGAPLTPRLNASGSLSPACWSSTNTITFSVGTPQPGVRYYTDFIEAASGTVVESASGARFNFRIGLLSNGTSYNIVTTAKNACNSTGNISSTRTMRTQTCSTSGALVAMYPNPATSSVDFSLQEPDEADSNAPTEPKPAAARSGFHVAVYDNKGQLRWQAESHTAKLHFDSAGLPRGLYGVVVTEGSTVSRLNLSLE